LGSIIRICFKGFGVADIGLAEHAMATHSYLDSATVVEMPFFFVAV
jgi:hypothetical protein